MIGLKAAGRRWAGGITCLLVCGPSLMAQGAFLGYGTWLGGAGYDAVHAVATDQSGFIYVAGETASIGFAGCAGPPPSKGRDAFVAKLTPGGTSVVYCQVLGGAGNESVRALATDSQGNTVVAGVTTSSDFPVTQGAYQGRLAGQDDIFVVKLSPTGALIYSTYLGGASSDGAQAVAIDGAGAVYVGGYTTSYDFPTSVGAMQVSAGGSTDGYIAKLNESGTALSYSTFLGGNAMDGVNAVALDGVGRVWAAGYSESPNFPGGAHLRLRDGFAVRLNAQGSALDMSLSVSGMGEDTIKTLWLGPQGQLTAGGETSSVDFPVSAGAAQQQKQAGRDGFVCQWALPAGTRTFCTLLGGGGWDSVNALGQTADGRIWAAGQTTSVDFPVVTAIQPTAGSTIDAWVAALSTDGRTLQFSSYLRGAGDDGVESLAIQGQRIWVAGATTSAAFPVTGDGPQSAFGGNTDGWLVKLTGSTGPDIVAATPNSGTGMSQKFILEVSHPQGAGQLNNFSLNFSAPLQWAQSCQMTFWVGSRMMGLTNDSAGGYVGIAAPGTLTRFQNSQCSVDVASSSVSIRGNSVVLTVKVEFNASYANIGGSSNKGIHLFAIDRAGQSTGWMTVGTWGIPTMNRPPAIVALNPSSGAGMNQKFRFILRDDNGTSDLRNLSVVIGSTLHWDRACFFTYWSASNFIGLADDAASVYLGVFPPGSTGASANNQCALVGSSSSVIVRDNEIQLDVTLSFSPTFAQVDGSAVKQIFAILADASGSNTEWKQIGSWTVKPTTKPPELSPLSATATGTEAILSFKASDLEGEQDIAMMALNVSSQAQLADACVVVYFRDLNKIGLVNNEGTGYAGELVPGSSAQVTNGQCSLNAVASVAWGSGHEFYLRVSITLRSGYALQFGGPVKRVYAMATDRNWAESPWTRIGTWVMPSAASTPSIVSVKPDSGSGGAGVFEVVIRDANGAQDLNNVSLIVSDPLMWQNSCLITTFIPTGMFALMDDLTNRYVAMLVQGSSTSMANSQCEVRADLSRVEYSDYEVKLSLALTFKSGYATAGGGPAKRIHVFAVDKSGLNTTWRTYGTWLIL